jgi:hypothetical protein
MKFPSIQTLVQTTLNTLRRFPFTILFMLIACYYSMRRNHVNYLNYGTDSHYYYNNIILSAWLGLLLSLVVVIYAERNQVSIKKKWLAGIINVALSIAFYFSLPDHYSEARQKQFMLFIVGLHLLVAFVPYTTRGEVNGFWQYNKTLFLRFLTAVLYSGVLFIGLSVALLAVENLFKVEIKYKWYLDLWICLAGGFNTIFFLAGFPSAFKKLDEIRDYPRGLKIFTQYVLLPIITVYLVILYAYMFKIIGTRQWPFGWVSYLVLAFAVAGILSLLLIHPIRLEANNKWILGFSRFFYIAICPLIVLLFLAIERRISDYGITEERYIVLILTGWLAFITLYFLFSKSKNIKTIPVSLSMISLLISFGPWGVFSVSFRSQNNRLRQFLQSNNMLSEDQKLVPAKAYLHKGDADQIKSIVEYLVNAHGYQSMQPWFSQNLDTLLKAETGKGRFYSYEQSNKLLAYMELDKHDSVQLAGIETRFRISSVKDSSLRSLSGYEYFVNQYEIVDNSNDDIVLDNYTLGRIPLKISFFRNSGILSMKGGSDSAVVLDLSALVKSMKNDDHDAYVDLQQISLIMTGENRDFSTQFIIKSIEGKSLNGKIIISRLTADILLHFKHKQTVDREK